MIKLFNKICTCLLRCNWVKYYFKVILALRDYKLIKFDNFFILSYDTNEKCYVIWYTESLFKMGIFSVHDNASEAWFKWKVLMEREV